MSSNSLGNKRIAINTIIIYVRMVLVALIGFVTTRYVLQVLGASDYGLYNVVGGIVTMLSFISIAMITTTRRFVNVEMGKKDGDVNRIFNICLILHVGFAVLIYLIALTIGLYYVYNYLNVSEEKFLDARFVFVISTTVSAIGIMNVPYQALMTAFERFKQMAIIDFIITCLKIPLVVALVLYTGNHLRFYAIGLCVITLMSFLAYQIYCKVSFPLVTSWHFYKDWSKYKEILLFNNYTSMGAFAVLGRSQGSVMVINYFFGTLVNGAYAIAIQIESHIMALVSNIGMAANPQLTQSYSAGNYDRSFYIVCKITRFSALLMLILTFSTCVEINVLLKIWLGNIPQGTIQFCEAILLSLFVRSLALGLDGLVQATGKVKLYQFVSSLSWIGVIPLSILFFVLKFPPVFIIYSMIFCDLLRTVLVIKIVFDITKLDRTVYIKSVYLPLVKTVLILSLYYFVYKWLIFSDVIYVHLLGFGLTLIAASLVCLYVGMNEHEREKVLNKLHIKKEL